MSRSKTPTEIHNETNIHLDLNRATSLARNVSKSLRLSKKRSPNAGPTLEIEGTPPKMDRTLLHRNSTCSRALIYKQKKEKSTAILVVIVIVFFVCHIHRMIFRIYELMLPESALYSHFVHCKKQGRYHVPVMIYFLTHMHILLLVFNSSINFVIYCVMGRHFRLKLRELIQKLC